MHIQPSWNADHEFNLYGKNWFNLRTDFTDNTKQLWNNKKLKAFLYSTEDDKVLEHNNKAQIKVRKANEKILTFLKVWNLNWQ